jgi:Raf kinase inhibitor-like YbhB/YbcL family protein
MMLDLLHARRWTLIAASAMALISLAAVPACGGDSEDGSENGADKATPTIAPAPTDGLTLTSDAFADNSTIPTEYTCSGANTSPSLRWSGAPANTGAFVLLVDDADAPGGTFDHWVVYDLPASTTELPAAAPPGETLAGGGEQGNNGVGQPGYMGPCPPEGPEHHYQFRLFALDAPLNLEPGKTKAEVEEAMQTHILAETMLTGLFGR